MTNPGMGWFYIMHINDNETDMTITNLNIMRLLIFPVSK